MDVGFSLARARTYVVQFGSPVTRCWTDALMGEASFQDTIAQLEIHQKPSGELIGHGLPASGFLGETVAALALLDSLGQQESNIYERAVGFLIDFQEVDGGWFSAEIGTGERIKRTGEIAGLIARTPFSPHSSLDAVARYLSAAWSVEFIQDGAIGPIEAFFHFLTNYPDELADEALQWCGRELERGYRAGRFGALAVSRVFLHCHAHSLPGTGLDLEELVRVIPPLQRDDGSFDDLVCGNKLAATLLAVRSLTQFGASSGGDT